MIEPSTGPGATGSQGVDSSRRWFVNRHGMHMLEIPAGKFTMGHEQELGPDRPHEVTLTRPFFMCDREVWNDLFRQFIDDPNYPASEKPQGDDARMSPPTGKRTAAAAQIDRLTAQLAAAPDDPALLRARGMAAVNLCRDEQAVQDLTKYLEKKPADLLARRFVAVAHARLGQRDAATQAVAEIAKIANSSETAYSRAVVGSITGSGDDAVAALEQVVKADAGKAYRLYNDACAYALVAEHLEQREEGARGEGAEQEGALQDPNRAERIKRCKGRAIELLVLACDAGYSDYLHVRTDSDLESLWPLEGFQRVLARQGRIATGRVNWFDAVLFCNWLSQKEGRQPCYKRTGEKQKLKDSQNKDVEWDVWNCDFDVNGYRLPTEAEWEYSARAETRSSFCFGDDESLLPKYGYFVANSKSRAWPGAMLLPNAWGLFDIHGNLIELCWDWQGELKGDQNPIGPTAGSFRVTRGGGCRTYPTECHSSFRGRVCIPSYRGGDDHGFRVVCVGGVSVVSSRSPQGPR
jgi:formylglycine-generating enzyme required for sulfatase activity